VPELLSDSQLAERLKPLAGWKRDGKFITKTFEFKKFMDGINFVNGVARVAETEEHHPDFHITRIYRTENTTVTLSAQTHSKGGVTEYDIQLAEAIERMIRRARAKGRIRGR
jgi:4a-hydroxytetrahydrobiopterin dehydratase